MQLTLRIEISHNKTLIIRNPQLKVLLFEHSGVFLSYLLENEIHFFTTCEASKLKDILTNRQVHHCFVMFSIWLFSV